MLFLAFCGYISIKNSASFKKNLEFISSYNVLSMKDFFTYKICAYARHIHNKLEMHKKSVGMRKNMKSITLFALQYQQK